MEPNYQAVTPNNAQFYSNAAHPNTEFRRIWSRIINPNAQITPQITQMQPNNSAIG
jgi:hypothetical protein